VLLCVACNGLGLRVTV